ncbi:PAS domain S-box protein [Streptomyces thermocarboxydus]
MKPFAAAELLARVRANVELARLRGHHLRWRTALVDSLQEAFFVCDESGAVVEINAAFTDILGYGTEDLPYAPVHLVAGRGHHPGAHEQAGDAFAGLLENARGSYTVPVTRRDGKRLWIAVTYNKAEDPETGRRVTVGTFRDVTAQHYAVQRETALAALSTSLSRASNMREALSGALDQLRSLWHADVVLAAVFDGDDAPRSPPPTRTCAGTACRRDCGNGSARCAAGPADRGHRAQRRGRSAGTPAGPADPVGRPGRGPAVHLRGRAAAVAAVRAPRAGPGARAPDRPAASGRDRPPARHPRPRPAPRRVRRRYEPAAPAGGGRRLVRHRHPAGRAHGDRRR